MRSLVSTKPSLKRVLVQVSAVVSLSKSTKALAANSAPSSSAAPSPSRKPCNSSTTSAFLWPTAMRSEERRVGKECRSLCDWSSDVCSSDLGFGGELRAIIVGGAFTEPQTLQFFYDLGIPVANGY